MNLMEQLQSIITAKEARKKELTTKAEGSQDVTELRAMNSELATLNTEIEQFRSMLTSAAETQNRSLVPAALNPMATFGLQNQTTRQENTDAFDTPEYRSAFMKFAQTGVWENRADAVTTTGDTGKVIPTTIMKEIIKELKVRGKIYARVRKLNVMGGVDFPILSLKPTATWISETASSDRKKVTANTAVSFSYYGLECKIATSLVASITSMVEFESQLKDLIVEAMIAALDTSVISGTGVGSPKGITVDARVLAAQKITLLTTEFTKWESWKKKVFAKIPLAYRSEGVLAMACSTWEGYIDGMVDTTGQPIARTNYNIVDAVQERFAGREVMLVEPDVIADYDTAAEGDIVAIYFRPSDYGINSNLQMTIKRYFDEDKNEWVDKAIMIVDGKLLDPAGVLIVKKGGAV